MVSVSVNGDPSRILAATAVCWIVVFVAMGWFLFLVFLVGFSPVSPGFQGCFLATLSGFPHIDI